MTFLGVDYGFRFVGLALSPDGQNTLTLSPLRRQSLGQIVESLFKVCSLYQVTDVIFGLPQVNAQKENSLTIEIRKAAQNLLGKGGEEGLPLNLHFASEYLTTFGAGELARAVGGTREGRRKLENSLAAGLILKNFLEQRKNPDQAERKNN